MSETQVCAGVFRQKCGRYVAVTSCEPQERGQRWTDGVVYYADDGTVTFLEGGCAVDLVEYIGPFPQPDQTAEIERLKAQWQTEFTAAQQLRSEGEQLERLLDDARDNLRVLEADGTAMDNRAEGARLAFLDVIKALWEMRR